MVLPSPVEVGPFISAGEGSSGQACPAAADGDDVAAGIQKFHLPWQCSRSPFSQPATNYLHPVSSPLLSLRMRSPLSFSGCGHGAHRTIQLLPCDIFPGGGFSRWHHGSVKWSLSHCYKQAIFQLLTGSVR
ncbi:uncharacterized protein [Panulirus ornatus]|uniref:uncharacterized protein n=1 Tax=Panulirus ornatus TaxID=150431 RepID=UPI003A8532B3